jgi:hypothetical protein
MSAAKAGSVVVMVMSFVINVWTRNLGPVVGAHAAYFSYSSCL